MLVPRQYQIEAINRGVRDSYLLADECGLGKTLTAIETVKRLVEMHRKPALIVIPKTLLIQWRNALVNQGVTLDRIAVINSKGMVLATDTTETAWPIAAGFSMLDVPYQYAGVVLVHYEAMVKHHEALAQVQFSTVVADEAHRIKNRKAQRTVAIKKLRAVHRLAMSGTPYDKNPADIWSILNWLHPRFFTSYWRFFDAHVSYTTTRVPVPSQVKDPRTGNLVTRSYTEVKTPNGVANAERFSTLLRQFVIKRAKVDVRADLPPRIETRVPITLGARQHSIFKKLTKDIDFGVTIDDVQINMPIVLTQVLKQIQATTDPELLGLKSPSAKLEWVQEWLEDNENESVIIFTRFRDTAIKVAAMIGDSATLIIGGTKRPTVTPANRIIVGTTAAMGEGLDLPWIDNAIFIDCEYSSILMTQAIDRIHRINIDNAKNIMYLCATGTTDELVYDAVALKLSQAELVAHLLRGIKTLQNVA